MRKFKFFRQLESIDCGATCLKMIANYYDREYDIQYLRDISQTNKNGVSLSSLISAADKIGFESYPVELTFEQLCKDVPLPAILFWKESHYVVAYKVKKNKIYIADPAFGTLLLSKEELKQNWNSQKEEGIALLLEPIKKIEYKNSHNSKKIGQKIIIEFIKDHKSSIISVTIILLLMSLLNLIYPYITKQVIDKGVMNNNMKFIIYFSIGQIITYTVSMMMDFVQSWFFLRIRMKFGLKLITSFLNKLINMPIIFFERKVVSDIILRIEDNKKIEDFLSQNTIHFIISIFSFIVFLSILLYYSFTVFLVFLLGTIVSIFWVIYFHEHRKFLNYKYFELSAINKNLLYEIIKGIGDIKINNIGNKKINEWNNIQKNIFELNKTNLKLQNIQDIGIKYITQIKNVIVIGISSFMVINNDMSLGDMLAVSFIIGNLNAPLEYFVLFIYSLQDIKISSERILDIHEKDDETNNYKTIKNIEILGNIFFNDVSFNYYNNTGSEGIFSNLNLCIKTNSITAIVGTSGAGKTTLVKMLMKFYSPTSGEISVNNINISNYESEKWRKNISAVFQDGYIFSDTIVDNIIMDNDYDEKKFISITRNACIYDFIQELPQKEQTKIGENGIKLSKGQEQRILIARAMYKNPQILILDEATSSLDAENEKNIHDNLQTFFKGRTVIIVAHRLSTVKNANSIVVLKKGKVVEQGTHKELVEKKGKYYNLIKNQLELGN